jgi:hypothetical protein
MNGKILAKIFIRRLPAVTLTSLRRCVTSSEDACLHVKYQPPQEKSLD